jgi:hypothetical protein
MRQTLVALLLALLWTPAPPAPESGSLDIEIPGNGPVHIEVHVSGVARYDGLYAYDAKGGAGLCRKGPAHFLCDLQAPAHIVILYVAAAPRCGVRPTLRWTAGDEHGIVVGPEPSGIACAYLPAVAQ